MTYATEVAADNPLHWWRGSESPSPIAVNHGSLAPVMVATATTLLTGITGVTAGGASAWDPGNYDFNVGTTLNLSVPSAVEIWVWIPFHNANTRHIWAWDCSSANAMDMFISADDKIHVLPARGAVQLATINVITFGHWHHLVMSNEAAGGKFYLDSVLQATGAALPAGTTALNPYLGGCAEVVASTLIGLWTEAAYYGAGLSAARVLAHYNAAELKANAPQPIFGGVSSPNNANVVTQPDALQAILNAVVKTY